MKRFATLTPYIRRYALRLMLGLLALLATDTLQLLIPRVVKHAVDHLSTAAATTGTLARYGAMIVVLAIGIGIFRYVWRILILGFSRLVEEDIRNRLVKKLMALPSSWYLTKTTGDTMAKATNDMDALRMASGMGLVAFIDAIVMGAASIGFMIYIDPTLALLALIPMPMITIMARILGSVMYKRYKQVQDTFGAMSAQVREHLAGIRVIQAGVREKLVLEDLDRIGRRYVDENVRLNWVSGAMFPLMIMFTNISMAIVLYFGGRLTIFNTISPGDFVAFISYLGLLTWPMMALGWVMNLIQRGAAALGRLDEVLNEEPDIADPANPVEPPDFRGEVTVKALTFSYPTRNEKVLKDVSLTFPAGKITALVGRTGSGKTTLLNLVPRLFDPAPGTVFIDGADVTSLRLNDLRSAIGYVPQDGYIFDGTIRENIAFGRPDSDMETVRAAARAAEIETEIDEFPDGFESQVGERGLTLSGGQRQRIALARALLMDAPLLILDDTFSALDADAEERILNNLAKIRADKTTIIVSHRLTSLRIADLVHVLEEGRLSQSGAHEELVEAEGYYANLHHLQAVRDESEGDRKAAGHVA